MITETETKRYPLNVADIEKGDYIEPEEIAEIYSVDLDAPDFRLMQLQLCAFIEMQSAKEDRPMLPKCEGAGIRILTDEEASRYRPAVADSHARALRREVSRMLRIDVRNLSDDSKLRLEKEILRNSKRVVAIRGVDREIRCLPSPVRRTPSMLTGSEE